jgi:lysophospholipase L1-like esterase
MLATGTALGLLPLAVAQFAWLRNTGVRLRAARGPRAGRTGDVGATPLRLLVLGDDTVVGVGCSVVERTLAPRLAYGLSGLLRFAVDWRIEGGVGWTALRLDDHLRHHGVPPCDAALVVVGAEDAASFTSASEFRRGTARIRDRLLGAGARLVAFAGVPAIDRLPALSWPLGTLLGRRARQLDRTLRTLLERTPLAPDRSVVHLPVPTTELEPLFARDGIHLSAAGYARWAALLADALAGEWRALPSLVERRERGPGRP